MSNYVYSLILVGNKADIIEYIEVNTVDINTFAGNHKIEYIEVSAKENKNIEMVFEKISREAIKKLISQSELINSISTGSHKIKTDKKFLPCC